jgi:hypothetical protein
MADPHYNAGLTASSRCQPATRPSRRTCPPDAYRAEATLATTPDGGGRPELPVLRAATRACGTTASRTESALGVPFKLLSRNS